jgi:hypothetical protein
VEVDEETDLYDTNHIEGAVRIDWRLATRTLLLLIYILLAVDRGCRQLE